MEEDEELQPAPAAPAGPPLVFDGDQVAIRDPDGTVSMVARGDLGAAMTEGAVPASEADWQRAKMGATGQIAAGAIGVGQGATFGYAAPIAIRGARALGAEGVAEDIRRGVNIAKNARPDTVLGGELVGALAGAALVPGGSAKLVEGTGLLSRGASRLAGAAPRLIGEGIGMGVGQQLTEDTLGNKEAVAEKYVAAGLEGGVLNLLLGGGLHVGGGAAFDAIGGVARKGYRGAESVLGRTETLASDTERTGTTVAEAMRKATGKDIEALAEHEFGYAPEGLGEKIRSAYVKGASGIAGKDRGIVDRLTRFDAEGREARRIAVFDSERELEAAQREFRDAGDKMLRSNKLSMEEFQGELKAEKIAAAVKSGNEAEIAAYARQQIAKVLETAETELRHEAGVAPQSIKSLEGIARTAYHADADIAAALAKGGASNPEVFMALDRVKRDVQRWVQGGYKGVGRIADPYEGRLAMRSVRALDSTQESLRRGLEDASMFGKAAEVQAAINKDWTTQIDASKRFHQSLTTEIGRDPTNPFVNMRGIDPAKADSYARNLLNPNADLTHVAVRDYIESTERLAKTLRDNVTLPPAKMAEVKATIESAARFRAAVDKAEKTLTIVNQFKHLTAQSGDGLATVAGMLGLTTGPLGAIAGAGLASMANPGRAVAQLAALERMGTKVDEKLGGAVKSFLTGAKSAVVGGAKEAGDRAANLTTQKTHEIAMAIRQAMRNPAELLRNVEEALTNQGLAESAPRTALGISTVIMRAAAYLNDKAPASAQPVGLMFAKSGARKPSDSELARYTAVVEVVDDPIRVIARMSNAGISREHVDALKVVYPQLYEAWRSEIARQAAAIGADDLTIQQEQALSIVFGIPVSAMTQGKTVKAFQQTFAQGADPTQQAPGQASGQPAPTVRGLGRLPPMASGFDKQEAPT